MTRQNRRSEQLTLPHHRGTRTIHSCSLCATVWGGCVSLQNTCVSRYQRRRFKLTNSTQSNVAKDDDDENNTANHISAAPVGGGGFDMESPRLEKDS